MQAAALLMGGVGVQHGQARAGAASRKSSSKLWAGVAAVLVIAASALIWQRSVILDLLVPGFQVTGIHSPDKTMSLQRANRTYLVHCGKECNRFLPGHSYRMDIVGGELRYYAAGRKISLPILEEEEVFTRTGGHG